MANPTRNEGVVDDAAELAAAARDLGMEQLQGAKGQLAEGAERVASAMERTADDLESDGDATISGFGHSLAGLMRQLAGGLRERDIEQFASELGSLARRNPGVFLAGSVALGFGVVRFFKARPQQDALPSRYDDYDDDAYAGRQDGGRSAPDESDELVADDESLDLSQSPTAVERRDGADDGAFAVPSDGLREQPTKTKARAGSKPKAKPPRAATTEGSAASDEAPATPERGDEQS